jgi:hypothetical protein
VLQFKHEQGVCIFKAVGASARSKNMELTINETQAKELLKQIVVELVEEKRDLFYEIIVEALEETGLANAIREGRQNEFVPEAQITAILEGQA